MYDVEKQQATKKKPKKTKQRNIDRKKKKKKKEHVEELVQLCGNLNANKIQWQVVGCTTYI